MTSIAPKAKIAQVQIGNLSIEGLMTEDGAYGISYPQLVSHDLVPQDRAIKELKARIGVDLKTTKWRVASAKAPVNVVLLPDFEKLLFELAITGNKPAQIMARDLVGLALTQLFADAFGQKFEKEERQAYLIERQAHREDFHPKFTIWLKSDGCEGAQYAFEVNRIKRTLQLPIIPISEYDSVQLRALDVAYIKYDTLRTTGMSHSKVLEAIKK